MGEESACDYCSEATAVIYCRADSARLCVFCDRQVHGANALSRKHIRSQICSKCGDAAAISMCSAEKLPFCQDCDSAAAPHTRAAIEGFSGCPSFADLAASWGLELDLKESWLSGTSDSVFADLYVPCFGGSGRGGKGKKAAAQKQLEEMARRDVSAVAASDLSPRTPGRGANGCGEGEEEEDCCRVQQLTAFGSLVMMGAADCADLGESQRVVEEGDLIWGCGSGDHAAQVLYCY